MDEKYAFNWEVVSPRSCCTASLTWAAWKLWLTAQPLESVEPHPPAQEKTTQNAVCPGCKLLSHPENQVHSYLDILSCNSACWPIGGTSM